MGRNADTHIRVTEETWQELNQKKGPGDSFDDVITQLLDAEDADGDIEDADVGSKEIDDIMDAVKNHDIDDSDDDTDDVSAVAGLPETPEVGDVIDHPTMGRVRVVGFEDSQILVEAIDESEDDDDTETITADELDPKNLVDDMSGL